jgi:GT2 family glycosyltransferase
VSIVIPTWNGRPLLERFLPSVIAAAHAHSLRPGALVEVIVVDDGSADGTAEWVEALASRAAVPIRLVRHERNLGFGGAANTGVERAAHPLVWLLNNDVDVESDGILPLASAFTGSNPELFAVHSRMIDLASNQPVGTGKMGGFDRGFLRVHRSFVTLDRSPRPFWSMFATGGSAMFRRALFLELGGFDPIFAPFYMEDVELSYRAWKRGYSVRYEPRSTVRHQFSSTIGPIAGGRVERISQRNRLVFHWIHLHDAGLWRAHLSWLVVLLLTAPITLKFGFLRGFAAACTRAGDVRERRRREKAEAIRSDTDVLRIFANLDASGAIRSYGNPNQLDESTLAELSTAPTSPVERELR